jgi:hypothetical protein
MKQKKISDVIQKLNTIMQKYGDLPCISASDDEGNCFFPVYYDATPGVYDDGDFEHLFDSTNSSKTPNSVCLN